jgi:AraC-like DNA-binding protein
MSALQVNILLLSLGAIQGVLVFILLLKKRRSLPGFGFLAAYLGVMLLQVTLKIADKGWLMQNINPLYQFSYQLPFLYGPLLYLFVVRFTRSRPLRIKDIFHFLPGAIVIGIFILARPNQYLPGLFTIFFDYSFTTPLQVLSIVVYHLLALFLLKKYAKPVKWLKQFTMMSMVVCSIVAIVICLMYFNNPQWYNVRFGFLALTFFIYWISYMALSRPELFAVIRGNSFNGNRPVPAPWLTVHLPAKKYINSGLDATEMDRIVAGLESVMKQSKPYLDPQLTIDQLAQTLGCSRHHLSQAINDQLNQSFYDYINQYRVAEAKALLTDPAKTALKIAAIAYDSGFNSISTFNDVFKKIAGLTPSQFRKQAEDQRMNRQRV